MQATKIEWTDYTANPLKYRDKRTGAVVWGCVKKSSGCAHCYSETLAKRYGRGGPFTKAEMEHLEPFLDEKELKSILRAKVPAGSRCFIGDMAAHRRRGGAPLSRGNEGRDAAPPAVCEGRRRTVPVRRWTLMNYTIVTAATVNDLVRLVRGQLADGWGPAGGVGYDGGQYLQAMVRRPVPKVGPPNNPHGDVR